MSIFGKTIDSIIRTIDNNSSSIELLTISTGNLTKLHVANRSEIQRLEKLLAKATTEIQMMKEELRQLYERRS